MSADWIIDTPPGVDTVPDFSRPPLARLLSEARARKGLTQADVARIVAHQLDIPCSQRAVSSWEAGVRMPHLAYARALSTLLGVGMRHLCKAAEDQRRQQGGTNERS